MPTNLQASETEAVGVKDWVWRAMAMPGLAWLVLLFIVPLYAIVAVAMGKLDPILLRPLPEWNPFRWDPKAFGDVFSELFGGQLGRVALRTIVYVIVACAVCLIVGYPIAYFVARRAGKRRGTWLLALMAPFWINYLMRMLAWVNLLGPDGQVNKILSWIGLHPPDWLSGRPEVVILGLVYGYLPFFILPLYASLDRMDQQVMEASRDLGASPWQTFRRVTLPMSKQGVLAGLVLIMLPMFGDYYTPNLLSGSPRTRLIGNEIDRFINQTSSQGGRGAALTLVLMTFVALLMVYYLLNIARVTKEARE
jgi:spermidine/putrescine transport system permease protein